MRAARARPARPERSIASRTKSCCRSTSGRRSSLWLFDQSGSLKPQRESIAKRFDRVYKELGIIEESGNEAFKQHERQAAADVVAEFGSA